MPPFRTVPASGRKQRDSIRFRPQAQALAAATLPQLRRRGARRALQLATSDSEETAVGRSPVRDTIHAETRRPIRSDWRALLGPWLLITATGAVAMLFLHCCARKSLLDTELVQARRQVEQLRIHQQAWNALIAQERDPGKLRAWADTQGMVFTPARVDRVQLSQSLPPPSAATSPLAALQPAPPGAIKAPAEALARAPDAGSPE